MPTNTPQNKKKFFAAIFIHIGGLGGLRNIYFVLYLVQFLHYHRHNQTH
jgi:hypothetical protein